MSQRIHNFNAGPGVLPESVLRQAQHDLWNVAGSGMGIAEHSHRGKLFEKIIAEAEADARELAGIPDRYRVLFVQGGATMQFAMVPMRLLGPDAGHEVIGGRGGFQDRHDPRRPRRCLRAVHPDPGGLGDPLLGKCRVRTPHNQQHHLRHPVEDRTPGPARGSAGSRHLERHVQPPD